MALTETSASTVHLLAHSRGNRALVRAIERLVTSSLPAGSANIGQVIFAAPDIDRDVFLQIATVFRGRCERFTLYASDHDVALRLSKVLHQGPRAGDAGGTPVITQGVDTVDASDVDTSLFGLGHSYYADRRSILSDIFTLLTYGTPPPRFELTERASTHGPYWCYRL